MKRTFVFVACCLLCFALIPRASAEEAKEKIKVLLVTGGHGFEVEPFFKIFSDNQEITFTAAKHAKDADVYERPDLLSYDVVVLYDMAKSTTDVQRKQFLAMLEKGTGLVVLHHALVSYPDFPEYEQIIGGRYSQADEKTGLAGYQHDVDIPVQIVAKEHPITKGIADFMIHDEIYWGFRVRPDAEPLITTTHPRSGKPLAWTRTHGKSRIVYLQLGHGPTAYEHPQYRELVARCIHWAAKR
jgi:type 1 glutamine amidotransferase